MPEGDTIHRLANALRPHLEGRPIESLWLRDRGELSAFRGVAVEEVVALGKHLLIAFENRWVFHGHLGMSGKWFRHAAGEAPRRSLVSAVARIDTPEWSFACFRAPVAELLRRAAIAAHPVLARLGPDLLAEEIDLAQVAARARRSDARSVADLLLDQRVACGIGNVYKNEVLFVEREDPWTPPQRLADGRVAALYATARGLMQRNLGHWKRTTVAAARPDQPWPRELPRVFVYGRGGEPCLRCGAQIVSRRHGDAARTTYWCPRCQRAATQYMIDASQAPRGS